MLPASADNQVGFHVLAMVDSHDETNALAEGPEDLPPSSTGAASRSWSWSPAWKELVGSILFFILCMIPFLATIAPRTRPIPFQLIMSGEYILNLVNNESFDSETISTLVLFVVSALVPFGLQVIHVATKSRRNEDTLHTICVYLVGFGLTMLVTETLKSYVGYLRPSFYDLCEPTADYTSCTAGDSNDARKSFPSGHASTAFCGFSLFSRYLERTYGVESVREVAIEDNNAAMVVRYTTAAPHYHRFCSILCLLPMALAIYIAASRVVDNKHFPADVVAGSLLGAASAHFANRLWFPSLLA
ncbi:phosphatidate phosphatase [Fragilaria crotonensis]|nr:phosphatidate phosphatase [Fragilaria crotonensis]